MLFRAFSPNTRTGLSNWIGLSNDLRFALRQARKRALFSAACITVLAFGLGANTAIFAVLYAAVLQPLPFRDPAQFVAIRNRFPLLNLPRLGASSLDYLDLREHHELFAEAGAYYYLDLSRSGIDVPVKVNAVAATASLFRALAVKPLLGRLFNAQEQRYHGPHALLLSEDYWRTWFAADPKILQRSLRLDGEMYPVIGVMPRTFQVPNNVTQMWAPVAFSPRQLQPSARGNHYLTMYARLAPGLTFAQASARIEQLSRRMSLQHPDDYPLDRLGWRFFLQPLATDNDGAQRFWLFTLFAAVTCLLLIVGANIAGLLALRSTERQFDVSLRMALGASRLRIARQVLAEVMLLAFLGALAAILVARIALQLLHKYSPLPDSNAHLAGPVLLFGSLLCLLTGLACSLVPAWTASRAEPGSPLKEAGHQRTAGVRKNRLRHGFIIGQVAIATALLLCGGLLLRSMMRLIQTPPGFDAHNVLTVQISLPPLRYPTQEPRLHFYEAVLNSVRRMNGVTAASACDILPFGWGYSANTFEIVGPPKPPIEPYANVNQVFPDFFSTLRIPLLRGRNFDAGDRTGSQPVALIDQAMVDRYFTTQDPIGQFVQMPSEKPFKIVGVVGRIKNVALDTESRPTLYFNAAQRKPLDMTLIIRSSLPQGILEAAVQRSVAQADKDQPIYDVVPLEAWIGNSLKTRRFVVDLVTLFAALGTLLAALGLYALLSYTFLLRRREIAIRMALGASRRHIGSLVARTGMAPVLAGIVAGCAAAIALQRYLASQLFQTSTWDTAAWSTVLLTISITCSAACALPMWRAARLEPSIALREE